MQTDDDLVAAVAAGDRTAFSTLFRCRRPDVYRFALHMTGQPAAADDVTQEVFRVVMRDAAESVYKLQNITRAEPGASWFEVPADYAIRESGVGRIAPSK